VTAPSCREWLRRLDAKELSSRELVEHYLDRVDTVNSRLNAVVAQEPELARAEADAADARRSAGERAPLLGLPLTIKDALEVRGYVSACGSFAREGFRPERDATVVARLREAGAIVLGKTNVPEYCWAGESDNMLYGRTNHPRDVTRTPGGSSGGEAAILATDASPAGMGSDGGASIRLPCHYCGIVGLRPTAGRVPETGHWPASRASGMMDMNSVGPMARFVEDIVLLLPLVAGPDGIDPYASPVPLGDSAAVDVRALRVGFYAYDGIAPTTEGIRRAVEAAARALADHGCDVTEATPPDASEATELFFNAMAADGGAQARADVAAACGRHHPQMEWLLADVERLALDASGYFALQRRIFELRAQCRTFLTRYDVVVCPVTTRPAPQHGDWGGSVEGAYRAVNYTQLYSLAGLPVVVVPAGEEDGLPVGVQIVAQAWHDHVALAAAAVVEETLGGFVAFGAVTS
jgi:amidase